MFKLSRKVVPLLVFLIACGPVSDDGTPAAGDHSRENLSPIWDEGDEWTLPRNPAVVIGEADGAPENLLSSVKGAGRLSDGRIVIANGGTYDLRWFAPDGKHLRTVGRKGSGPGEFRWIDWMGVAGDSVFVWDGFARRLSVYDGAALLVRTLTFRDLDDLPFPQALGLMDGMLVLRPRLDLNVDDPPAGEQTDSVEYLAHSLRDGKARKHLGPFLDAERFVARVNQLHLGEPVIFGREGLVAVSTHGFYTAETDRFSATHHRPDGRVSRMLRRPHTPIRAPRADVVARTEEIDRELEEIVNSFPNMAAVRARLMDELPHRSVLPAVTAMAADREGRLWMRGYASPGAETADWSVFDTDGRWLGDVALPADLKVLEIGDGWVLGKRVGGEDGVEQVVLHTIQRGG